MLAGETGSLIGWFVRHAELNFQWQNGARSAGRTGYLSALLAGVVILLHSLAAAAPLEIRRVLILNEVGTSYPLINLMDQGIRNSLANSPYRIEFDREYLDTLAFPDPDDQQMFRDFYIRKYQNHKPDVIVAVGPSPLRFMVETHQKSFPGVPIVFCLPNTESGGAVVDSDFTGVESDIAPAETIAVALRLQPDTKHVVVVGGIASFDRQQQAAVREQLKHYEGRLDISYLTELPMPDLLERLRHLSTHTIVIETPLGMDSTGTSFTSAESGPMIATAANAPVFTLSDRRFHHGEVGGDLSNAVEQGKVAGEMVLRLLRGEKPQDIPRLKAATTYMFDWRALKRWGFDERKLPPGSIVVNRQRTLWGAYRWYIVGGIFLLLAQTSLIVGLLWQRTSRRKAEAELALTYDRLRLAVEAGKAVGWDLDAKTGSVRWFGDLRTMFGIPSDTFNGHVDDFYRHVYPDDREPVRNAVADARRNHRGYAGEFRVVREDQTVRWIRAKGTFYNKNNGEPERMTGMALDITDRKFAEQQVRESQDRLAAIVGSAMDAIIATDNQHRIVLFNSAAQRIFGCSQQEALGASINRFIPQRYQSAHSAYMESFSESGVTNRVMGGLWAVRADGQEFPIDASISHVESAGTTLFTVVIRDITGRLQAETAVRESERRFRLVANTAPVMIWMSGTDKLCNYFNKPWLDFTGRTLEQERGDGWAQGVHSEDIAGCLKTYTEAFDEREQFEMQYRLRRHDGEYRWIYDIGVPRFNEDGSFAGYIGSCLDVTERKRAEEALSTIGRRLIEAQERERTRIARELHDDINQRIAMLSIELDMLKRSPPDLDLEIRDRLDSLRSRLLEVGRDIQGISHRLHSSKLEYLGLGTACKSFCSEFAERHNVSVAFTAEGVPRDAPPDISVCLFRVLQESLNNAIKHSGSHQFEVELHGTLDALALIDRDHGVGFDVESALAGQGLGLISMRERVAFVRGSISIFSRPQGGTEINVRIPLCAGKNTSEMMTGAA